MAARRIYRDCEVCGLVDWCQRWWSITLWRKCWMCDSCRGKLK